MHAYLLQYVSHPALMVASALPPTPARGLEVAGGFKGLPVRAQQGALGAINPEH
jgi:hypothetical protein